MKLALHRLTTAAQSRCRLRLEASSSPMRAAADKKSVWLASRVAERALELEVLPQGKGQVIVVSRVEPGSEAAQVGIKRGQKLVGISDPVRDTELWDLGDRPSLRFVRDALRLRRTGQIQLVVQDFLNTSDPTWAASPYVAPRPSGPTLVSDDQPPPPSPWDSQQAAPKRAEKTQVPAGEEGSAFSPTGSFLSDDEGMTIGERMAAEFAAREAQASKVSEVKKRIARRSAYMDEVSQRNDSTFFGWVALAFLGPAAIILGIAAATGYLDTLYANSITIR